MSSHLSPSGRFRVRAAAILSILAMTGPGAAFGSSSNPADGRAGDPPSFQTCVGCHASFPLNSGQGTLTITGLPSAYHPGVVYPLTVGLVDPTQTRWGFELTAIRDNGLQAGTLAAVNPDLVQVSAGPGDQRDYIKHRSAGTFPGQAGGASWGILWTAPAAGTGSARFYVAGNAANNNNNASGDYIYAVEAHNVRSRVRCSVRNRQSSDRHDLVQPAVEVAAVAADPAVPLQFHRRAGLPEDAVVVVDGDRRRSGG